MIRNAIEKIVEKRIVSYLQNTNPEKLLQKSEIGALKAFQKAARTVPAYRQIIKNAEIDPAHITNIKEFKKKVPLLNKEKTFIAYRDSIRALCTNGNLDQVGAILSSSGHSGNFSYGLLTRRDLKDEPHFVDFALDRNFSIAGKRTLLINCLPMGVKVPSQKAVVADISVRKDIAISLVRGFGRDFDMIIIVGENSFMKEVLEFGQEEGLDWTKYDVRIVVGEEGFPESYRSYIAHLLGVDLDSQDRICIGSSMGISELGLTVFQENADTIRIRRHAEDNDDFRYDLFGGGVQISPMLFAFYPMRIYLEEDRSRSAPNSPEFDLLFTNLNLKAKIPLIRYASGDRGRIITYTRLSEVLHRHNLAHLLPQFKLPLAAVFGRSKIVEVDGEIISPEEVKAGLYSDIELPLTTTGNFKMRKAENAVSVMVQLKNGIKSTPSLAERYRKAIGQFVRVKLDISLYPFEDFPYPLDYERKLRYIS